MLFMEGYGLSCNGLSSLFQLHIFLSSLRELGKVRDGPEWVRSNFLSWLWGLSHSILFSKNKVRRHCLQVQVWEGRLTLLQLQVIIFWLILMRRSNLKIQSNRRYEFMPDCRFLFTGFTGWINTQIFFSLNCHFILVYGNGTNLVQWV